MGQLRSACRALLLEAKNPSEVIGALDSFAEHIPDAACTTVFCAAVDPARGTVAYSCAGHVPGLVIDADGTARILDGAQSVPLAVLPGTARPEATATLAAGASLVLYTDGLVERRRESLEAGVDRLAAALRSGVALDPEHLAGHVMQALLPSGDQADDVALIIYRQGFEPEMFRADVPADAAQLAVHRRQLRQWLRDCGADEQTIADVLIASGEAVANAMEHAYDFSPSETVEVTVSLRGDRLEVVVRDHGGWKPPGARESDRGRGFPIIRALMENVEVDPDAGGTTVRLETRLRRAG
jgi:anti-sigma regulatory factor (Ser/Thr protein kinase)